MLGGLAVLLVVFAIVSALMPAERAMGSWNWSSPTLIDNQAPTAKLASVSCSSAGFCAAVDTLGNVLTSTYPQGGTGAWGASFLGERALLGVSCPSSSLCVAGGESEVVASADPVGGAVTWADEAGYNFPPELFRKGEELIGPLASVSCTSALLCVASLDSNDEFNELAMSVNPLGGQTAWTLVNHVVGTRSVRPPYDGDPITGVSCVSLTLCVAVDAAGNVMTSAEPGNDEGVWTIFPVDANSLRGVTCPSTSLCVAVDNAGHVLTSTNPTGGSSAWTVTLVDPDDVLQGVACVSQSLCIAVDAAGRVLTSTDPTGGAERWTIASVDVGHALTSVSCTPAGLCVAVDSAGYAVTAMLPSETGGTQTGGINIPTGASRSSPPPGLSASVLKILRIKVKEDGRIVLTLMTSGAGSVNARAMATVGETVTSSHDTMRHKTAAPNISYGMRVASAPSAGMVTVTIKPSKGALGALRRLHTLRVVLNLTFRPRDGSSATASKTVVVRYAKHRSEPPVPDGCVGSRWIVRRRRRADWAEAGEVSLTDTGVTDRRGLGPRTRGRLSVSSLWSAGCRGGSWRRLGPWRV
jgi:hypothetical protein